MPGLLDARGGFDDPITMGLLGASQALLTPMSQGGGLGAAFGAFPAAQQAAEQRRMRELLQMAQMGNLQSETEYRNAQMAASREEAMRRAQLEAGRNAVLGKIASQNVPDFRDVSAATTGVKPTADYVPPQYRNPITREVAADWMSFGGDLDVLKKLAESGDWGRREVARVLETTDTQGRPQNQQIDRFGGLVGSPFAKPYQKNLVNTGGSQIGYDPYTLDLTGQTIANTMSPGEVASNQVAWANNKATLRAQDMTDSRARELAQITAQSQADARAERAAATESDKLDKGVADLANRLDQGKVPQVGASIRNLNSILSRYSPETVPGLGLTKNLPAANFFLSDDGKMVKSSAQAVANDLLSMYSGMAVTLPEAERRALESMSSGAFNARDFYNAWPKIVERYNAVSGNVGAGFSNEVRTRYAQRPGAMSLDPVIPTAGASSGNQTGSQSRQQQPSGPVTQKAEGKVLGPKPKTFSMQDVNDAVAKRKDLSREQIIAAWEQQGLRLER